MPYRLTKIYTKKGDEGFTTLGDKRISKDDLLVEAIGSIDELNSAIGLILSNPIAEEKIRAQLLKIQNDLFDLGAELHLPEKITINEVYIKQLESWLDEWNKTIPPLKEFLLPGGTHASASCHLARTICRRAERCLVRLHRHVTLNNLDLLKYLNRLSDYLFVLARILAKEKNKEEKLWEHE